MNSSFTSQSLGDKLGKAEYLESYFLENGYSECSHRYIVYKQTFLRHDAPKHYYFIYH